jgi:hypothetical protein
LVNDKFTLLYPDASAVEWKEQNGKYLAEFRNNKMETSAIIRADGYVLQTETEIKVIALPPAATKYLIKEENVRKIEEVTIIEDEPGVITFKAKADNEEYWFDGSGQPMGLHALAMGPKSK